VSTQRLVEGETELWLKSLANELGLSEHVVFTGARTRIQEELKEMDIFVMPSILEGMSNAILEAMATGLPVIATDSGGNRELVDEGGTGYLFPVGDDQRLGELLLDLLGSEEKRRAMGRAGRQRVMERFTVQRMVAELERVYLEGLGRGNG
jgi:glycosyltransferase involved in cell wall biosynthesis